MLLVQQNGVDALTNVCASLREHIQQASGTRTFAGLESYSRVSGVRLNPLKGHQEFNIKFEIFLSAGKVRRAQLLASDFGAQAFNDCHRGFDVAPGAYEMA